MLLSLTKHAGAVSKQEQNCHAWPYQPFVLSYLSEGMMRGIDNAIDSTSMAFFIPKLLLEK
jgi:hypothetical protein